MFSIISSYALLLWSLLSLVTMTQARLNFNAFLGSPGRLSSDLMMDTAPTTLNSNNTPRGGSAAVTAETAAVESSSGEEDHETTPEIIRVAYQGEPGAYSEKATRELLGQNVLAVGRPNFEACFRAVASGECDYACLPIENSLGGSIHENYDLMLRYDLTIIAEHEFRVKHCLLVKPGVKRQDIKYAISHPQALAQCDNFLRGLGITPVPTYDTAGSAKMISEGRVPDQCTVDNTAAIASDLAGRTYGLQCLNEGIEDDDTNFTRFLLLARKSVVQHLSKKIPAKTSVVFTLPDTAGALYKALACFSLRDIDFSKIESRPTSASLLNFLKFKSQQHMGRKTRNKADLPRFRYCFYLDFLAHQLDETTQHALAHLREQADFVRILGSYPQKSRLVGPVARAVEKLKNLPAEELRQRTLQATPSDASQDVKPLNIGIIGFDNFGKVLARQLMAKHRVSCLDEADKSGEAEAIGIEYFPKFEQSRFLADLDVVILSVSLLDLEDTVQSLPAEALRGKLVVEMCPLNAYPKAVLMRAYGQQHDIDLLSTHPMFGPIHMAGKEQDAYATASLDGRPFVYEKVRVSNRSRCEALLKFFEEARCQMVEMNADQHDSTIADAEFVTHMTGRLLHDRQLLPPTPVVSKEYAALCDVADMTADDPFDVFFGLYKFHSRARDHLVKLRDNVATLERQLAAKEAYVAARAEMRQHDRQRLLAETKLLLQEVAQQGGLWSEQPKIPTSTVTTPEENTKAPDAGKEANQP